MERQLLERMIGAGVLLVALVVIVPAILDGRPEVDDQTQSDTSGQDAKVPDAPLRQHTIRLDSPPDSPPVARQAAENVPPPAPTAAAEKETQAPAPAPQPEPVPETKPAAKVATTKVAAAEKKLPTPKPAQPTAAPEPQPPAARPAALVAGWVVQLGSFSSQANAQGLADRTRAKGFASYLMPIERSGKRLYRVRVGPPRKTRDEAAGLADDLRKAGFKGQVAEQKAGG